MAGRTAFYGGIVSDGLVFHMDASKQESYAKDGIRYLEAKGKTVMDFADPSISPSTNNTSSMTIVGTTFSNFAPYHRAGYVETSGWYSKYWHDTSTEPWKSSAGIGTYYGNIEFDGIDDYIMFNSTPELTGITDVTVSAWFYVNKFRPGISPNGGTTSVMVSRYSSSSPGGTQFNGWELGYDNSGMVWFGGRESSAEYIYVTSSYYIKDSNAGGYTANGGWYNAVGTKEGNTWKIYVAPTNRFREVNNPSSIRRANYNSNIRGTKTAGNGTTAFGPNPLILGRGSAVNQYLMNGRIMQVSIYNRALSLAEINRNHESFSKRIFELEGIPQEACPGQRVVFQICNSNAQKDDNFDIYLNGTASANKIGTVDLSQNVQIGSVFIGDLDPTITISAGDFTCPLENMVIYRFDPSLLRANNLIYMKNIQNNNNGNAGTIGIRNYSLSGGVLSSPCVIYNVPYGGGSGQDLGPYSFSYATCCGGGPGVI